MVGIVSIGAGVICIGVVGFVDWIVAMCWNCGYGSDTGNSPSSLPDGNCEGEVSSSNNCMAAKSASRLLALTPLIIAELKTPTRTASNECMGHLPTNHTR